MSVELKQVTEIYEVSTEKEAEELVSNIKSEYNVIKSSITYKYKKKDDYEYYIVEIKKLMEEKENKHDN